MSDGGGRLLPNPQVVAVKWCRHDGTGCDVEREVDSMPGFFTELFHSPYLTWLSAVYGRGTWTFGGAFKSINAITPYNSATHIYGDAPIAQELDQQIAAGNLPSYSNAMYVIYLPTNVTFEVPWNEPGQMWKDMDPCVNGDPGAYHSSEAYNGHTYDFAVIGDPSPCHGAFNGLDTTFEGLTWMTSHELVEHMTDPDNNAWKAPGDYGEIADLCSCGSNSTTAKLDVPEHGDQSLMVDQLWDNSISFCRTQTTYQSGDLVWLSNFGPLQSNYESLWKIPEGNWYASNGSENGTVSYQAGIYGVGDINADGVSDLLWADSGTGAITAWFMQNGIRQYLVNVGTLPSGFSLKGLADVNGDGTSDVILMNSTTGEVRVWILTALGGINTTATLGNALGMTFLGIGDFNHDGIQDLAFSYLYADNTTSVAIWLLNGASILAFSQPVYRTDLLRMTVDATPSFGGVGDFDGDGQSDLAWQDFSGNVTLWHLQVCNYSTNMICVRGGSGFPTEPSVVSGAGAGYYVHNIADVNGDGFSDLIFNNKARFTNAEDVYTWRLLWASQTKIQTYTSVHTGQGGGNWNLVGTGFFNWYPNVW